MKREPRPEGRAGAGVRLAESAEHLERPTPAPGAVAAAVAGPSRDELAAAAAALGIELQAEALDKLIRYAELLRQWGAVFNLTAIRDAQGVLHRHLVDCLAIVPAMRREQVTRALGSSGPLRILDVGSGAGLPAVVLAIVEPTWEVHAVDAVAKKVAFIRQAAAELALPNLQAHHGRVESLKFATGFGIVTARAFSSLRELVRLTERLLAEGGIWLAMKGLAPAGEIEEASDLAHVFHVEHLHPPGVDGQRCIVWMQRRTDSAG